MAPTRPIHCCINRWRRTNCKYSQRNNSCSLRQTYFCGSSRLISIWRTRASKSNWIRSPSSNRMRPSPLNPGADSPQPTSYRGRRLPSKPRRLNNRRLIVFSRRTRRSRNHKSPKNSSHKHNSQCRPVSGRSGLQGRQHRTKTSRYQWGCFVNIVKMMGNNLGICWVKMIVDIVCASVAL